MAGQNKTEDTGAKALMQELAAEELRHASLLKNFKEKGLPEQGWHREEIANLMISEYLTGPDTIKEAGLQETLVIAMKREQQSVDFYSSITGILRDESAKRLCQKLVDEELKHKLRLETFYDDLFYGLDEVKKWEK
jgi:rubrerythrin